MEYLHTYVAWRVFAQAWLFANWPTVLGITVFGMILMKAFDKLEDLYWARKWDGIVDVEYKEAA